MITNKVATAKPQDNYKIEVYFVNGLHGIFDMTPYLETGVFKKLKNPSFFNSLRVQYGTLTWPEDIDIAPETIEAEIRRIDS